MEGRWSAPLGAVVVVCCALATGGCGKSDSGAASPATVKATDEPELVFAPLVQLPRDERWRPMSARWFLERAVFGFAEDRGCADRKIAVGRTLPEQRGGSIDWIFPHGLGAKAPSPYYRNPYGARCELNFDVRVYANQPTRPHDRDRRVGGLRPGEGFYMDLTDAARVGPATADGVPVYTDRTDEGDSAVRLTYWMLYGMNEPKGRPAATHEGDWERIDVLLHTAGDNRYEPQAVQLTSDAGVRDVPWRSLERAGTHPVISAARGSHAASPAPSGERCAGCTEWRTWEKLRDVRDELWYGFGGAWGEIGSTSATTGPVGPHPVGWQTRRDQLTGP
jgi:hypothetical protein